MDRRLFFSRIGAGATGMLITPSLLSASKNETGLADLQLSPALTGRIMSQALIADCSKLLNATGKLNGVFSKSLETSINLDLPGNMSRLGPLVPYGKEEVFNALQDLWKDNDTNPSIRVRKISLLLGWYMTRPLRQELARMYMKMEEDGTNAVDIPDLLDVYMIRQFAANTEEAAPGFPEMRNFFNLFLPRMITRLHTLKPDYNDGPGWVVEMSEWRQGNHHRMDQFGRLLQSGPLESMIELNNRYHIYDPEDPLVALVRNHSGTELSEQTAALNPKRAGSSLYARSLANAYQNIILIQDMLEGKISTSNREDLK